MNRDSAKSRAEYLPAVADVPSLPLDSLFSIEPNDSLSQTERSAASPQYGVMIGTIVGFSESGQLSVDFAGRKDHSPLIARTTVSVGATDIGREVVLVFAGGDLSQPIIVGLLQTPRPSPPLFRSSVEKHSSTPIDAVVDGKRIVLNADKEIVLSCGKASITLTQAGKVLIRGAYVLSRSSGVNRVKGSSVQIN